MLLEITLKTSEKEKTNYNPFVTAKDIEVEVQDAQTTVDEHQ